MANFTVSTDTAIQIALNRGKLFGRDNDLWEEAITSFIEDIDEVDGDYDIEMLADDFIINHAIEYTWEEFEESFGLTIEKLREDYHLFNGSIWAWNMSSVIFTA
jgi:hypothetical protein